ncbi:MAG: hypothetical protein WD313_07205 [Acidimicrobiia bacterium]
MGLTLAGLGIGAGLAIVTRVTQGGSWLRVGHTAMISWIWAIEPDTNHDSRI